MHSVELVNHTFSEDVLYWIEKIYFYWYLWVREFWVSLKKYAFMFEKINMMENLKSSTEGFSTPCVLKGSLGHPRPS